jgi:hypothetical protein
VKRAAGRDRMPRFRPHVMALGLILLAACQAKAPTEAVTPEASPSWTSSPSPAIPSQPPGPSATPALPSRTPFGPRAPVRRGETAGVPPPLAARTASGDEGPNPEITPLPAGLGLDPADWHDWPVVSPVPENARQIYLRGQALGNDPHAFSVFGDCQSEPTLFMGGYESNPALYDALPPDLQETVDWFRGSFNRASPTVRSGATAGALLWTLWHQNKFTCTSFETPLQCELRIHRPSFVLIHLGTHYEDRNEQYMRMIVEQLIAAGVVPILSTKADNHEMDEHVNYQYAQLAVEYSIPFWNFWAAAGDLPNRGLYTESTGNIYLTPAAMPLHRLSALQALDAVRRAVIGGE